jgi:hypothetical protein
MFSASVQLLFDWHALRIQGSLKLKKICEGLVAQKVRQHHDSAWQILQILLHTLLHKIFWLTYPFDFIELLTPTLLLKSAAFLKRGVPVRFRSRAPCINHRPSLAQNQLSLSAVQLQLILNSVDGRYHY